MSEFSFPGGRTPVKCKVPANVAARTKVQSLPGVLNPFEPDSQEAVALRGAMSFLFTLITVYGELLEQDAGDPSANGESGNH